MRRAVLLFLAPALAMVLWAVAPLAAGSRTLFLRDVLNSHLPMRIGLGNALRSGELPLVDPLRAGGQGLLGNPNVVPLYPDNLLLLVASDLWQLNAHFWLHWLLAFPAMYALARCWRLGREASFAAGAFFALSGYFLSQLNLYNAVAGVALAPALAAALLASAGPRRRRWALAALGGMWALQMMAGDPLVSGVALVAALLLAASERRALPWGGVALALAAGSLVAAPQWIEMLRLLPGSHRGYWGQQTGGRGTPDPRALIELLLPMHFGRVDQNAFWGRAYYGGNMPLYGSLAPGLVVLALGAAGLRRFGSRERWTVGTLLLGTAVAFSGGSIVAAWRGLPGEGLFRLPVKFVLLAALAGSLLAAAGLERLLTEERARVSVRRALGLLLLVELGFVALFFTSGGRLELLYRGVFASGLTDVAYVAAKAGWAALAVWQALVAAAALAVLLALRHRPLWMAATLVALHAATQLVLLHPLRATDDAARYTGPPALLAEIPADAVVTHGCYRGLFCNSSLFSPAAPDLRVAWSARRGYDELYSFSLLAAGRRNEFLLSPEGLDAFPLFAALSAIRGLPDGSRTKLLAATGVTHLIVDRPLEESPVAAHRELPSTLAWGPPVHVYRLDGALPEAALYGRVRGAPEMGAALRELLAADFDSRREVVLSSSRAGLVRDGPMGRVKIEQSTADRVELKVDSPAGGALVVRRAWLSSWRAEIDGRSAPVRVANLSRLAVEVPPGAHRVRFYVSRRPFALGLLLSCVGVVALIVLARRAATDAIAAGSEAA